MTIKHISLDVWRTLVDPRPAYGELRTLKIAEHFKCSEKDAEVLYSACSKLVDLHPARQRGIFVVCALMHQAWSGSRSLDLGHDLGDALIALFEKHPPIVSVDVVARMHAMRAQGMTFSIASNSGRMFGRTMDEVLQAQYLPIEFSVYDSQPGIGASKPDKEFFVHVLEKAEQLHPGIKPEEILHIGDRESLDSGAASVGMRYHIIRGTSDLCPLLETL